MGDPLQAAPSLEAPSEAASLKAPSEAASLVVALPQPREVIVANPNKTRR
jgi:hypothetical protein